MNINRSKMKKILSLLLVFALVFSLSACEKPATETNQSEGEAEQTQAQEPATAEATVQGFNGDVTVKLTVEGNKLTDIQVTGDKETLNIGSIAIKEMPDRMLKSNSIEVDAVSGATITSFSVMGAAKKALEQINIDPDDLTPIEAVAEPNDPVTTDVLVIGGGGAGIGATVAAREAGKEVVLLEKLDILGGNTALSGGVFTRGAKEGDPEGSMTSDELYDFFIEETKGKADPDVQRTYVDNSVDTQHWAFSMGSGVPDTQRFPVKPDNIMAIQALSDGVFNGQILMAPMIEEVLSSGADIRLGTAVTELIVKDGVVIGAKAIRSDGKTQEFYARNGVVLATGGFAAGKELLAKYSSAGAENAYTRASVGSTGDGIKIAEAIGADVKFGEDWDGIGTTVQKNNPLKSIPHNLIKNAILINNSGKRFIAEDAQYPEIYKTELQRIAQGDTAFFFIHDSNTATEDIEELMQRKIAFKADTLEELAKIIEVPEDTLLKTVARYNELGKNDTDFGKQESFMLGINDGPFYAIGTWPVRTTTIGGLVINEEAQVLDTEGNPIPGLYAGGEVANYSFFYNKYATCGSAVGHAIIFGRISGNNAANFTH